MFLERIKKKIKPGQPIFVGEILSLFPEYSKAYVFRLLTKAESQGQIIRFSRGVYCIPKKTVFGNVNVTSGMVANNKYVRDKKRIYGVYSGLSLLNQFAFSSQVPNVIEIVTNNETSRKRIVVLDGMEFVIRKSRFEITNENYPYYTLLQLFLELGNRPLITDISRKAIRKYMSDNDIKREQLFSYAQLFPGQVSKNLLASEVL